MDLTLTLKLNFNNVITFIVYLPYIIINCYNIFLGDPINIDLHLTTLYQ